MGENRSFDNLLGWLYTPDTLPEGETFDGLAFGDYANPDAGGRRVVGTRLRGSDRHGDGDAAARPGRGIPVRQHADLRDGGSRIQCRPRRRRDERSLQRAGRRARTPTMQGFVLDYRNHLQRARKGKAPEDAEVDQIMGGFSPEMLPVLSTLAREFAVFDAWFAGVPSQTYCNRSFFHASTSHGNVTNEHNGGHEKWLDAPPADTIFNRLDDAGLSWKVYYDEQQLVSLTGLIHAPVLRGEVAHEALRLRVGLLRGGQGGHPPRVCVHRAATGVQPQRLPSTRRGVPGERGRRRTGRGLGRLGCARGRGAGGAGVRRHPHQCDEEGLERAQHAPAHHVRRARRHVRPRPSAGSHAADG